MFHSTKYFRILSIDPGSNCCGFSVLDCFPDENRIHVSFSHTVMAKDVMIGVPEILGRFDEKTIKIFGYAERLASFMAYFNPDVVVSESPFLSRHAQAFRVLSELTFSFGRVVAESPRPLDFIMVDPPTVKKAVGVKGNSNDKEDMRNALEGLDGLSYANDIYLADLDEHAIDSICVGIWFSRRTFG